MMKVKPVKLGKTERMSFSHIGRVISMPNLIEVRELLSMVPGRGPEKRSSTTSAPWGLHRQSVLGFVDFRLDKEPKYSIKRVQERDVTCLTPLRVTARLLNKETGG